MSLSSSSLTSLSLSWSLSWPSPWESPSLWLHHDYNLELWKWLALGSPFLRQSRVWVQLRVLHCKRLVLVTMIDVIIRFIAEGNCQDLNHDPDANLIHPHLPESKTHPLLDIISIKNWAPSYRFYIQTWTSGHSSFSSFNTSLVSSGVGGTALYCWKYLTVISFLVKFCCSLDEIMLRYGNESMAPL